MRLTAVNRSSVNRGTEALYQTCYSKVSVYMTKLTEILVNLTAVNEQCQNGRISQKLDAIN